MSKKIKPVFPKKMPKNAFIFFHPAADEEFKVAHPWGYRLIVTVGVILFLLPLMVYGFFVEYLYPAPDNGWILLGMFGAFMIGTGLFNIAAAWVGQYLGHKVTVFFIAGGLLVVLANILLTYNKCLYAMFDQDFVLYYFINILFLALMSLYYFFFRSGMEYWLQEHKIRRSKKDPVKWRDFWWYEDLHRRHHFGFLYHLNRLFIVLYALTFCLHLLFGWIKVVAIPVAVLFAVLSLLFVPMNLFSAIMSNKEEHGRVFVLLARTENGGFDSILLNLVEVFVPIVFLYAEIELVTGLWGMSFSSLLHNFFIAVSLL